MTWYPSSELLLDPSPLRVSNSVPGQLARSTARELALQRSRAPRPFATRGASPGAAGFALAIANEAWNLLLQQEIPSLAQSYPVDAPAGSSYRLTGSITFKRREPPPFDILVTEVADAVFDGPIVSVGVLRSGTGPDVPGAQIFEGIAVIQHSPPSAPVLTFGAGKNIEFWEIVDVSGIQLSRIDTPTVPIPGGFPTNAPFQQGDSPDNDLEFPITIPGGIPGLCCPSTSQSSFLAPQTLESGLFPFSTPPQSLPRSGGRYPRCG